MEPDAVELRVVGCLVEKQRTTPDAYPLSLNALRLACNQSTNREPVVHYDEPTIRSALERLSRKGWVRLASGPGSRAAKYRQLFDDARGLSPAETALLAVLMLRGPQTLGELKQRTARLFRFESPDEVARTLDALSERELAARVARRPGQKEERFALVGGETEARIALMGGETEAPTPDQAASDGFRSLEERVARLEEEVAELRRALESVTNVQDSAGARAYAPADPKRRCRWRSCHQ